MPLPTPSRVRAIAPQPSGPRGPRGRFRRRPAPTSREAAPAPPSHIGRGRAARSPPRPPDRAAAGPRAPPPAAAPTHPFICGSRCHKMALRKEARLRRPTPFPLLPPLRARRPAPRPRAPPSAHSSPVRFASGRLTDRRPPDGDAITGPQPDPAAGRKGERTAPDRTPRRAETGAAPRGHAPRPPRRAAGSAGEGEIQNAGRGWAARSEVSREASREGRRGSRLVATAGRARRPPAAAAQLLAEESEQRRRVIGRLRKPPL